MAKSKTSPAPASQPVTIYVNSGETDPSDPQSPAKLFVPKEVTRYQLKSVTPYLKDSVERCSTSLSRALIMQSWLLEALNSYMDGLPLHLFNYVSLQSQGQSAAAMPYHDNDETNFTFLLNYPSTNSGHAPRTPALDFEGQNISFQGVAALILPSSRLDKSRSPDEPLIILYMANSAMLPLVENHWGGIENAWRLNRLLRCPLWLYIDLLQACGHWSEVWGVAGHDLAWRNTQAYQETSRNSTLRLTRRLHRATSNVITLRENLRLHISSTERFQEYVQRERHQSFPMPDDYQVTLSERTGELLQDLRHHWATSEVILEQFKSLQHGNRGTRTSSRPPQSARLRFLAFDFVAGVFGMTTRTISAIWYPLWAFVAVVVLIIATYIVGITSVEDRGGSSLSWRLRWDAAQSPRADIESRSVQKPLASSAIAPTAVVTGKMPPSAPTQTSLYRFGSYGRNQRASRRARRQVQRANADAITPPSGQPHRSRQTIQPQPIRSASSDIMDENSGGEFSTDPDETSTTFPPALPEARTASDRHSAVEMNHPHYANHGEGSGVKKHVAFEEYRPPSTQVTREPHGRHQERQGLAYDPYTESAEMYHTEILPPVQDRHHRPGESPRQQDTYRQRLDISVQEAEMLRPIEIVPPGKDRTRSEMIKQLLEMEMRGKELVLSEELRRQHKLPSGPRKSHRSQRRGTYHIGLNLAERSRKEAE
ncbi:hypothetical protein AJ79_08831 [Helicocarpus griseus UAMH5409]|uniref:Uncharacterized protein n=1 Tax=Helicocarpus griseus UAMH5409 TaxID=1447875 RepID=A0A2B7WPS5_9EURO|nr:hypothetical protein AJ79_08831 [Helicocarpus griseus UAMH5409]